MWLADTDQLRRAPRVPRRVEDEVTGDREHPPAFVADRTAVLEAAHHPEKRLLRELARGVGVARHPQEVAVDVATMSRVNLRGPRRVVHASPFTS